MVSVDPAIDVSQLRTKGKINIQPETNRSVRSGLNSHRRLLSNDEIYADSSFNVNDKMALNTIDKLEKDNIS